MPPNTKSLLPLKRLGTLTQYSAWGFVTFLLGLASLYVLYDLVHIHYYIAVPLSVMVNLVTHYAAARTYIFKHLERPRYEAFVIFVIIGIAEIFFITVATTLLVEYCTIDVYWARIIAGVVAAVLGFYANARYNFKAL